jgi:hypothetical protein
MSTAERERNQQERARQAWELVVLEAPNPEILRAIRKTLRVKRFELPALAASLPGCIRRGARVDLAPLEAALREAGVRCELKRSAA